MILTKAKCHFLLNNTDTSLQLFKEYEDKSSNRDYKRDVEMIKICMKITDETTTEEML